MARAHTIWLVIVNGKPSKAFTVKHECQSYLADLKGWNLKEIWKLPDGQYPLFVPKRLDYKEFMENQRRSNND